MAKIWKSEEGEQSVRERYLAFLKHWPVPHRQLRVPTCEGETFIIASGPEDGPAVLLFHGSMANSASWIADIAAWSRHFRVFAVDVIGDAGLSAPSRPPLVSDAYALWVDDVMQALSLTRASLVGVSLGGWLALDYATRRPDRVESLAVLCPAGVGPQKIGFVFKVAPLRLFGGWGRRKAAEIVLGRAPANPSPAVRFFMDFIALIHRNFRPRKVKFPIFSDEALKRLAMPTMAILGGRDVLLDSAATRKRLERNVPQAEIRYFPEAGHFIPGQTQPILEFLHRAILRGSEPWPTYRPPNPFQPA